MKPQESNKLQNDLQRAKSEIDDLHEELRKATAIAEQTRAEMRQKFQELAREFRGSVTSVLGFSQILGATDRPQAGGLNQINAAGQQLMSLITNLENPGDSPARVEDRHTPTEPIAQFADDGQIILYIEDNETNFRLVECVLEDRFRTRLHWTATGEGGIEFARKHSPALILLDLNLPDAHGSAVLTRLQGDPLTAKIPVIVISADATASQIERMLQAGARNYLIKPFDIKRLLCLVDEALEPAAPDARHATAFA